MAKYDYLDQFPESCRDAMGNLWLRGANCKTINGESVIIGIICSIPTCKATIQNNEIQCAACDYMDAVMSDED